MRKQNEGGKVSLPFSFPKVCTYPYFSAIVGILDAYGCADVWIYNNYILVWMFKDVHFKDYWIDFKYGNEEEQKDFCPMLKKEIITRGEISDNFSSLKEAIIYYIDRKRYLMVSVDVFYIEQWWSNGKERRHFRHQLCVQGYDLNKNTVIASDFMKKHEYTMAEIDFDIFTTAYENFELYTPFEEFGGDIWLLHYNEKEVQDIDLVRIRGLLDDFINSSDTCLINHIQTEKKKISYVYGVEMLDELIKCVEEVKVQDKKYLDRRPFHILVELHKIMLKRMNYLIDEYGTTIDTLVTKMREKIDIVGQKAERLLLLDLKYNICGKKDILDIIILSIIEFKGEEVEMMSLCKTFVDRLIEDEY